MTLQILCVIIIELFNFTVPDCYEITGEDPNHTHDKIGVRHQRQCVQRDWPWNRANVAIRIDLWSATTVVDQRPVQA